MYDVYKLVSQSHGQAPPPNVSQPPPAFVSTLVISSLFPLFINNRKGVYMLISFNVNNNVNGKKKRYLNWEVIMINNSCKNNSNFEVIPVFSFVGSCISVNEVHDEYMLSFAELMTREVRNNTLVHGIPRRLFSMHPTNVPSSAVVIATTQYCCRKHDIFLFYY